MNTFQYDQGGRQYLDSKNMAMNQGFSTTSFSQPIIDYQRSADPTPPIYPFNTTNNPNLHLPRDLEYPQQFNQNVHQYDNNQTGHPQFQFQQQSQFQNRGQAIQNASFHQQQRIPVHQEQNFHNFNRNFVNDQEFSHPKSYLDQVETQISQQQYDNNQQKQQFQNYQNSIQNQSDLNKRQFVQNNQNQIYLNLQQQFSNGYNKYPLNENQAIYQNQQQNSQRFQQFNQNFQNGSILQNNPIEQNEYYRIQQIQNNYTMKQDCDMTQSFYYDNSKSQSSSQTTIIQQTLQNQQMNPISFKNKFQQEPNRIIATQFINNQQFYQNDQVTPQNRFSNPESISQQRMSFQNDNMLSQRNTDSKDFQNLVDKQDQQNQYDNHILKYQNEIQQSNQSVSGRKMNDDIFQTNQNSYKNSSEHIVHQQNSIVKDQKQRTSVLQIPYVIERNLNAGNYETSESTNKQQTINQGTTNRIQSSQIQEIQNSFKQNVQNYSQPEQVQQQKDQVIQREIQELKNRNIEQQIRLKYINNCKRRFSTKSVKIKSGRSLRDISDINLCEGLSESKFEEDPQFLDDAFGKKGSNSEIKKVNSGLHKYSQFKNNQNENHKDISDEKSTSHKHNNNQLKLKLLQKLQQTNNTKSYDISLQGPSEIKQLSSKTSLQNQDKIGISKSDIDKIKQKSLNKFDNNSAKMDPLVKIIQQKSRESLMDNKDKVNSKDTISSKKRCNSLKIQDSLIEHVRQNGFQEGFSKKTGESPQIIQEKQHNQLPPIAHPSAIQKNNAQDTSQTSYLQKSIHNNDKIQLYNIISQENLPDIPMYSQKRMQQLGSKMSIKSSNLFAYSDTRSMIHPNQLQDLPFYQSIDRVNSKILDKNQEKDIQKIQNEQVNIINYRLEEDMNKNQMNQQNQQLTALMDRWGLKLGADTGAALNKFINQQQKNADAKIPIDQLQNGFILKENKIQKNLETFKTTQYNDNSKNANFMKPSNGKNKQNKTPNYQKEQQNKNSKSKVKMNKHSQNDDNQSSSSLSLSFTQNQTTNQNENNIAKDGDSNNVIKFVGLSEQINLDTSLTPNQNPYTPIQNTKKFVQKQIENIKIIPPQVQKITKDIQIQQNQIIQVKSGSFQESGGNEVYSFKTPNVKNRQIKGKSNLLKKPSFENNMKSSQGENLKSLQQSSHDKDQMLFKNSNNLSSIKNSDEMNKIQTDSFELNKEKVIACQIPAVEQTNEDCKTVMNKDDANISDYSGLPAPKRQLERTYSDISQISNNLYPEQKQNKFDDMKTIINEKPQDDNQSSLSAIQPYAPLREIEKSQSDISYVSRFGYQKKLNDNQIIGFSDIKTIQNQKQIDIDQDSSNSGIQAPQRAIERTYSDISQISQISNLSNNQPNIQKQNNQFDNIPKQQKDRSQKLPKHKQTKKQSEEYFAMKNQVTNQSLNSFDIQLKANVVLDQLNYNKIDLQSKQNNIKLSEFQNIYDAQKIIANNYLPLNNEGTQKNKIEDLRGKEDKQRNKKQSLNLPINQFFGKPALSQQSSLNAMNKQNSKYTASFTLNKDSVVISQKSASSFKEENQNNIAQQWSTVNTFGHINSGFYLKNPSKDLPRIEISEEEEEQNDNINIKEKEDQKQTLLAKEQKQSNIVHIADVEPGQGRRMSLANQDEPIKVNNIFQLRREILGEQPEMSEKNSNNALAQSGFFGRYSSNPNLLNFKFQ